MNKKDILTTKILEEDLMKLNNNKIKQNKCRAK